MTDWVIEKSFYGIVIWVIDGLALSLNLCVSLDILVGFYHSLMVFVVLWKWLGAGFLWGEGIIWGFELMFLFAVLGICVDVVAHWAVYYACCACLTVLHYILWWFPPAFEGNNNDGDDECYNKEDNDDKEEHIGWPSSLIVPFTIITATSLTSIWSRGIGGWCCSGIGSMVIGGRIV